VPQTRHGRLRVRGRYEARGVRVAATRATWGLPAPPGGRSTPWLVKLDRGRQSSLAACTAGPRPTELARGREGQGRNARRVELARSLHSSTAAGGALPLPARLARDR
jgi:hypothetical protein